MLYRGAAFGHGIAETRWEIPIARIGRLEIARYGAAIWGPALQLLPQLPRIGRCTGFRNSQIAMIRLATVVL